ncbi:Protein kinase domain [Macleaya cordata]|uniref:Protein kinase domain n=1 Tax=Macleaya cordata TaxID=56857 RepID=A0A200PXJ5_MACCD|nr:Protein kinase domain [Macleaya cordata]
MSITASDCYSICSRVSTVSFLATSLIHGSSIHFSSKNFLNLNLNYKKRRFRFCKAALITNPDDFEVGRFVGSYGFMNITSYSKFNPGSEIQYSTGDMERLKVPDVGEGSVKIRLYEGRIAQGPSKGTRVIFKVYPGQRAGGIEADMMAANELNAHAFLQQSDPKDICKNIQTLLGGFETQTGEQWLAFRNDGKYSAADYAKVTSEAISKDHALGQQKSWNPFDQEQKIKRRRYFVIQLLRGVMCGLAYMHDRERLHQSLGPASVVLNTIVEKDAAYLIPRLRDLAFSVDMRYSSLEESPGALSEGLWRRASIAGAFSPMEKRAFGIADDIYEAGLLFAYLAFVPFCETGIMDGLSLQRLLESTFQLDLDAAREYCLADDRLLEAVKFLDLDAGSGWELLQAMLNPDFRKRPIAEAVLSHRFLTAAVL